MKKLLLRVLTGTMMLAFMLDCYGGDVYAATITKTLDKDTKIMPPGVISSDDPPTFRKGTTVTLNEYGEVIEGTLAYDVILNCVPREYDENGRHYYNPYAGWFNKGTKVIFDNRGKVIKGTTVYSLTLGSLCVPLNSNSWLGIKKGTEVTFHQNGMLASGTIGENTYFRFIGWQKLLENSVAGFIEFKAGTEVKLNDKGELTKGTLNKDVKLLSPDGTIKLYEAGTTVEFDENGVVVKAEKPAS